MDLVYGGQVSLCVTGPIWEEYSQKVPAVLRAHKRNVGAEAELARLLRVVRFVDPASLSKLRSRDPKDDRYLAAALGLEALALVSNDRDLLALGKPFGFPIVTPVEFIKLAPASLTDSLRE